MLDRISQTVALAVGDAKPQFGKTRVPRESREDTASDQVERDYYFSHQQLSKITESVTLQGAIAEIWRR